MGGLSKKGFQFNKIATEAGKPQLILDAGNLLFKRDSINQEAQEKLNAETIVGAYDLIGYQAVAIGNKDLTAGIPYLQTLAKKAKFVWLSANLVDKATKKPLFKTSTTIKAGSLKAGVIGITGTATLAATDKALLLPWDKVLPALVAKVAKKNDLVILLSNLPSADNQRIAESYANIHLIIQSGATTNTISPAPVNNTILVSTGPQGKQIGIMTVNWQPGKRWGDQRTELLTKKRGALDRLHSQLDKYPQGKDQETALANQPEQLKAYRILKASEAELRGEIERMTKELAKSPPAKGEPSSYSNRFMAMEISLPDHAEVARIIDRLDSAVNRQGQAQAKRAAAKVNSPYLGSQGCGACHAAQLSSWQKTKHAAAYTTLVHDRKQFNQACLPCHVTGVTINQGQEALSLPEERRGVGCETCHGPGRQHSMDPKANAMTRKPRPAVCEACHNEPHDAGFNYEERIKLVRH